MAMTIAALALTYDLLISAGHEGRPASCPRFPQHHCNLGAAGEREWTPVVADEATRVLRKSGLAVARLPADFDGSYRVAAAVFVHFDGAMPACASSASVGYHDANNQAAARDWRALYATYWPFGFQPDNFTEGLREYYGYRQVDARDASLVLELGEITCPAQHGWLQPRLRWVGDLLAYYLSRLIGKGNVRIPLQFSGK